MVNTVLQMLKGHPKYHKNIKDAAESQQSIILNYHIHPGESKSTHHPTNKTPCVS